MSDFPSTTLWYRLTNNFTGSSLSLDVVNDAGTASSGILQMGSTGDFSGQYWRFINYPSGTSPTFAIYTMFLGPSKHLDVYGNDAAKPHLADAGYYSGQIWTINSWGDGTWQLTNSYSGPGLHLDVYSDTKVPFMGDGDHTGQHWTLSPLANVADSSSVTSVINQPTPTSSIANGVPTSKSTSTIHSTSQAAVIGPAVGATVGGILILFGIFWFLWSRLHRQTHFPMGNQQQHLEASFTPPLAVGVPKPGVLVPTSQIFQPNVDQTNSSPFGQAYYPHPPTQMQTEPPSSPTVATITSSAAIPPMVVDMDDRSQNTVPSPRSLPSSVERQTTTIQREGGSNFIDFDHTLLPPYSPPQQPAEAIVQEDL